MHTGSAIDFPAGSDDPDGSGFLFHLLTDRSPEAVQAWFEDYYERPVPLDAVRHVLAGHPLTRAVAGALNPVALSDSALLRRITAHPEVAADALTLAIVLPSWHDALAGFRPPALNSDYLHDHPDHPAVRDRLLAALRLPPATDQEVLDRLLTAAARTVRDGFLPHVPDEEDAAFEPMLEPSAPSRALQCCPASCSKVMPGARGP
ncbi:hypothetical protein ACF06P_05250 [Streptomyces sp. NPDC015684]|uniref:hypothetical protein n=1 Tax=Streptomyces sp. NPDC015684 TaxID=3364963 RepID=UPI003700ECE5